ncbi:MAG: hypothetical protein ACFFCE_05015 [Promethearchaeota archaeon]
MPDKKSLSNIFTLRLDPFIIDEIELIKDAFSVKSTSKIIKQAINQYITMNPINTERPNPKLILSHNIFSRLLKVADDKTLEEMAEISFLNGKSDVEQWEIRAQNKNCKLPCKYISSNVDHVIEIIKSIFSIDGQNWFENASYSKKENEFIFEGEHDMDHNFSIFVKYLISKYLAGDGYELIQEDYSQIHRIGKNFGGSSSEKLLNGMKLKFSMPE